MSVRTKCIPTAKKRAVAGSAVIELSLLVPWFLFLFIFVIDLGFYNYSLIAVENAARIGAEYTSQGSAFAADQSGACTRILAELSMLNNVGTGITTCDSAPVKVTATSVTGPDGSPATSVTVVYQGLQMIPIPGFMTGRLSFGRNVQMRVKP